MTNTPVARTADERVIKCPDCASEDLKPTPWPAGPDYLCNQCGCHFDMFEDGPGAIL